VFFCRTRCMRRRASGVDASTRTLAAIPPPAVVRRRRGLADVSLVGAHAIALLHVLDDALPDYASEIDGHGVADQPAENLELDRPVFRDEGVVLRESLEQRTLAQREPSRLS